MARLFPNPCGVTSMGPIALAHRSLRSTAGKDGGTVVGGGVVGGGLVGGGTVGGGLVGGGIVGGGIVGGGTVGGGAVGGGLVGAATVGCGAGVGTGGFVLIPVTSTSPFAFAPSPPLHGMPLLGLHHLSANNIRRY